MGTLEKKHRNLRSKYGLLKIPNGIRLGTEDDEVKKRLSKESSLTNSLFWRDLLVGITWAAPAAINGLCYICSDKTYFKEKIITGEAYKVGLCGPFFTKPPGILFSKQIAPGSPPNNGQIGRDEELIIIMSSPGDHHKWLGVTGKKNVHSTFEKYANESDGRVSYCPIQMGKRNDKGEFEQPADKYGLLASPEIQRLHHDYYVATVDAMPEHQGSKEKEGLDLWKVRPAISLRSGNTEH